MVRDAAATVDLEWGCYVLKGLRDFQLIQNKQKKP